MEVNPFGLISCFTLEVNFLLKLNKSVKRNYSLKDEVNNVNNAFYWWNAKLNLKYSFPSKFCFISFLNLSRVSICKIFFFFNSTKEFTKGLSLNIKNLRIFKNVALFQYLVLELNVSFLQNEIIMIFSRVMAKYRIFTCLYILMNITLYGYKKLFLLIYCFFYKS